MKPFQQRMADESARQAVAQRENWIDNQIAQNGVDPTSLLATAFRGMCSFTGFMGAPDLKDWMLFMQAEPRNVETTQGE
ncbi:hypothetical protein KA001_01100 [Patescibacteria group bacterium]|nr:hypothetical protein [Patescibacteria group bacterium]